MRRLASSVLAVMLSPGLTGCPLDEDNEAVAFNVLDTCAKVPQPSEQVFRSANEVREFWGRHESRGAPPEVDFSRSVIAARFDGTGSACVGFTVEGVQVDDGKLVVEATRHTSPDPCIAILAFPQLVLSIDATDKPVTFRIRDVQRQPPPGHQACS